MDKIKTLLPQGVKYLAVGGIAFIADNGLFVLLDKFLNFNLMISTLLALTTGLIISFIGNKIFVYGAHGAKAANKLNTQIFLYLILFAVNLVFSYVFIYVTHRYFGLDPVIAKLIAAIMIIFWNFIIYKTKIFKVVKD